jgi:methylated-DNA-[protein]-cysteine S-methyltransferase
MTSYAGVIDSPVGRLLAIVDGTGALVALPFLSADDVASEVAAKHVSGDVTFDAACTADVARQLAEYFAGERSGFDLRTSPHGTPFQVEVWRGLEAIPYGETIAYVDLARRIGRPDASRAVGRANGANPIPIVIPCHRVIGANGNLTGYGGGIDRKRSLLQLEGALPGMLIQD